MCFTKSADHRGQPCNAPKASSKSPKSVMKDKNNDIDRSSTCQQGKENVQLSQLLWEEASALIYANLFNPFVRELASGTLPQTCFDAYLSEDAYYLGVFRYAFENLERIIRLDAMVPDDERATLHELVLYLLNSMKMEIDRLHGSRVDVETIQRHGGSQIAWATKCYTTFLQHVSESSTECTATVLASLLPCFQLYLFVAKSLTSMLRKEDRDFGRYATWLETYSSNEFSKCVNYAEKILDALTIDPFTKGRCRHYYRYAMERELEFFGTHVPDEYIDREPGTLPLLIFDFDQTMTENDTICKVVDAAIQGAVEVSINEGNVVREQKMALYDDLVLNYSSKKNLLFQELFPEGMETSQVKGREWLDSAIKHLSLFEDSMVPIVCSSKLLQGATKQTLHESSKQIKLRPGCVDALRHALDQGLEVLILSVNWSAKMIASCLETHGLPAETRSEIIMQQKKYNNKINNKISVIANELEFDSNGRSTGNIRKVCFSGQDKVSIIESLVEGSPSRPILYVGDSINDISAMLNASIGIIMGEDKALQSMLFIGGESAKPLEEYAVENPQLTSGLYQTDSWDTIFGLISGLSWDPNRKKNKGRDIYSIPRVLLVSGSDSGGGAGMQADMKTCTVSGVFATSCITAVTVQSTFGVDHVHQVPPSVIRAQFNSVQMDIGSDAIKIGMLGSTEAAHVIAEEIKSLSWLPPVVLDPVLVSTSGDALGDQGLVSTMLEELFPISTVVTPNIHEASVLLGGMEIRTVRQMKDAARKLHAYGPKFTLIKGGHLDANINKSIKQDLATDILFDGDTFLEYSKPFLESYNNHGTGCCLASAIACNLAKGYSMEHAIELGKDFVWRALERSHGLPLGQGQQKPMNLAFQIYDWKSDTSLFRVPNVINVGLYAVSSPNTTADGKTDEDILSDIGAVVRGGAHVIQVRDKISEGGRLTRIVTKIVRLCRPAGVKVIVNDRVDVAIAADADGVHIGQGDISCDAVRRMIGPEKIIGVSCKTVELGLKAQRQGADYLGCGAVFPTTTKDSSVIGVEGVRNIREAVSIPVVAIGGIFPHNMEKVLHDSKCDGIAVVSAIFKSEDPYQATKNLRSIVDRQLKLRQQQEGTTLLSSEE